MRWDNIRYLVIRGTGDGSFLGLTLEVAALLLEKGGTLNPSYLLERRLRRTSVVEIGAAALALQECEPVVALGAIASEITEGAEVVVCATYSVSIGASSVLGSMAGSLVLSKLA